MKRLSGQVALVTGGAAGLGKAIAERLAAEGARVVISDIQADLGARVASEAGFMFLRQDVSSEANWLEVVREIEQRCGHLHILVNNAGILGPMDVADPEHTSLDAWRTIFAVNVEGVFLGCRCVIPAMRRAGRGSIVNLSSVAGLLATPYATAYGASKAAVRQLTKSVAQYCAEQRLRIRCNSVHPGLIMTPMLGQAYRQMAQARGITFEQMLEESRGEVPMHDFTSAEDVAAGVAFLVSEDARHVTGSKLMVDGGIIHCDTYKNTLRSEPSAQ